MKILFAFIAGMLASSTAFAETPSDSDMKVAISEEIQTVQIKHRGMPVTIKRIQDTQHRLTDDFTKTSRVCPPFCIQPIKATNGVETIGEIELMTWMQGDAALGKALILDSRTPEWYNSETIPMAINVPFTAYNTSGEALMKLFKVKQHPDGSHDFSDAYTLILFCNGPWCDQSPRAIKHLVDLGYPESKLLYYRGGMQAWKSFGLTTVVPKATLVSEK